MDNQEIKQEYLKIKKSDSNYSKITKFFEVIQYTEQYYGRDISELDEQFCRNILENSVALYYCLPSEIDRAIDILCDYKEYVNRIHPEIPLILDRIKLKQTINDAKFYAFKFFKNSEQFLSCINTVFDETSGVLRNLCFITTYLLIFNGIPLDSISHIQKEDLDFNKQIIYFKKNQDSFVAKMIPAFVPVYKKMSTLTEYKSIRRNQFQEDFLIPVGGQSREWRGAFSDETNEIIKAHNAWFQMNKNHNYPISLNISNAKLNGLMCRVFLTVQQDIFYLIPEIDVCTKDTDILYYKFKEAFQL